MDGKMPMIQVAGIRSLAEAQMLVEAGVTHLGMPLGPGVREQDVTLDQAAEIVAALSNQAVFVVITYLTDPAAVVALCREVGVTAVQLHDELDPSKVAEMKLHMPGLFVIKSLVVGEGTDVVEMARVHAEHADAFLTDTYDPATGARGATGRTHDWQVSQAVVRAVSRPVILAGGLGPANVAEALRATGAAGVDAHTGLEDAQGRKDPTKVRRFVTEALGAFP